jgi:hypothetical protein
MPSDPLRQTVEIIAMKLPQTGGCLCVKIRYEITEAPSWFLWRCSATLIWGQCLPNHTLSERGPSAAFSATAPYVERRAVSYPRPPMPNRPRSLPRTFSNSNHATGRRSVAIAPANGRPRIGGRSAQGGRVILTGPQRAAHVSTEALPRGRTRSLRSSNQLMAPTARNSRMPASFRTPRKISTAIAIRKREDRAKHGSWDNRPHGPGWETVHSGPAR